MNGKAGLFPSNFVKELDAMAEDGDSNDTTVDETGRHRRKQTGLHVHICVFLVLVLCGDAQEQ